MSLKSGESWRRDSEPSAGVLGHHDPLLDQLLEDVEIWRPAILSIALFPHEFVLKGDDLNLELLVEQL